MLTLKLRKAWNKPAPAEFALPTETWREGVARRKRHDELRAKLSAGEVRYINDLITLNLDIRQFAQDVIENCEGPELLRAFWHAIERITILDPTCGSGAFLFAALNILEPLYDACLKRMEAFVEDLERSSVKHRPEKYGDFRKVLANVEAHPNRRYFILKSIILRNLYGVDIMEEAVEICKLRLFLKLAAQVEPDAKAKNFGVEPLPDIDFHLRAGNTLVGYPNYEAVKTAIGSKFDLENAMEKIAIKAADLQQTFDIFRQRQIEGDGSVPVEHKQQLRHRLNSLEDELNRQLGSEYGIKILGSEYGIKISDNSAREKWLRSHRPFHWFIEFHGIMNGGGFDVVIGNPPYIELSAVAKQYRPLNFDTEACGNLYALCIERAFSLQHSDSRFGFIVQQPITSTVRMASCRQVFIRDSEIFWSSTYDDRPSKLFNGMHHARLAIVIAKRAAKSSSGALYVSRYNKWFKEERDHLFQRLQYVPIAVDRLQGIFPKISSLVERSIIDKLLSHKRRLQEWLSRTSGQYKLFYKITGVGNWFTITPRSPKFFRAGKSLRRPGKAR